MAMRTHCSDTYGRGELCWRELIYMPDHGEWLAADSEGTFLSSS